MLRHSQCQLARSCARASRSFATTTPTLDAVAATHASRRPAVTNLGGITIENIPAGPSSFSSSPAGQNTWATLSPDQQVKQQMLPLSTDRRQRIRARAGGKRQTSLGWQDELVSNSFASRLLVHGGHTPRERTKEPASSPEHKAVNGPRDGGREGSDHSKSQSRPQRSVESRTQRAAESKPQRTAEPKSQRETQNRPSRVAQPKANSAHSRQVQRDEGEVVVVPNTDNMKALEDTNFDTLFNASAPVPIAKTRAVSSRRPSLAGLRIQTTLARTAGDYSRYLSRRVAGGDLSSIAVRPVRYARQVLGFRRDVGLRQRKRALQVIGRMTNKAVVAQA